MRPKPQTIRWPVIDRIAVSIFFLPRRSRSSMRSRVSPTCTTPYRKTPRPTTR
jgi:hypothetical protein